MLETIALYDAIRAQPNAPWVPRVKIFAGKAAASYHQAKLIIKLACDVAKVVNSDPTVRDLLKVCWLPNYNVSLAEAIIPASDVSEQISTAGMEASGTGNMKLALNGALTVGTLDGANVEIRQHVGEDNIFIFGLTAEEVTARRALGIDATETIAASPMLGQVLDAVADGAFAPDDPGGSRELVRILRHHDHFLVDGGLRRLLGRPAPSRCPVARSCGMVAVEHPQHREDGLVFFRPHDCRVCQRGLATCRLRDNLKQ